MMVLLGYIGAPPTITVFSAVFPVVLAASLKALGAKEITLTVASRAVPRRIAVLDMGCAPGMDLA
ncbi:hypothetical protein GCM10010994_35700 [Chelatococcus reniformis]|uniref:Uncharacterized protein n=1 Tax=Chelatococcus reniformis TaxID=1494448 RepID=A0A916UHU9_9HYPH|nr:hypothetical protein GCM10010994_35700 [Chelatococcus reniformis]